MIKKTVTAICCYSDYLVAEAGCPMGKLHPHRQILAVIILM